MSYEAHIAGVGDRPPGRPLMGAAIRAMQRASARELAGRRAAVVEAVRAVAPLRFVNGGGTGSSFESTRGRCECHRARRRLRPVRADLVIHRYEGISRQLPAAGFALPVLRRMPKPGIVTCARRRLLGVRPGRQGQAASNPPGFRAGCTLDRHRGRGRGPDAGSGHPASVARSGSAIRSSWSVMPRQASCASASTSCC